MLTDKIRVSVIIPTRNEEKLLPGCLAQFSPELKKRFLLEVIVSDGASTDATISIAEKYADKMAIHKDTSHRQTIAEGRNKGVEIATGDILMFLNADTRVPNIESFLDRIQLQMSLPHLAALAVKVQVNPEERKLSDTLFHAFFNRYVALINFFGIGIGRGECQIVKASFFHQGKGYNESLAAGEDFDLYQRLRSFGKIKYDPKLLVYESPRRYRKYGYIKVYSQWVRNGFSVLFKNRSSSSVWEEVR